LFTFTGFGFGPGESVAATVNSTPVDLGTQAAAASGVVVFTWSAPADWSGRHQIVLAGTLGQVSAWFDVPAAGSSGASAPTGGTTGTSGWLLALSAGLLGLGLVAARRSRRAAYTGHHAR